MQQRSPVTIVLLGFVTCGIYHLIWMHQVGEEMRARGAEVPPTWHIIIPILNFLWMWKWAQAAEKVTNGALSVDFANGRGTSARLRCNRQYM